MLCPKCGAEAAPGNQFCPKCGAAMPAEAGQAPEGKVFCAKCGAEITGGAQFCPKCGAPSAPGASRPGSTINLDPNVAGLLCYLVGWITGLIFYLMEKENKFVRFHAMQSIVVFGALSVASIILSFISGGWLDPGHHPGTRRFRALDRPHGQGLQGREVQAPHCRGHR